MITEILSFVPFHHFAGITIAATVAQGAFVVYNRYNNKQQNEDNNKKLPEIDKVASGEFPMEDKFKNSALMVQALRATLPAEAAQHLKKIGFYYPDTGTKVTQINVSKADQDYAILIGTDILDKLSGAQMLTLVAQVMTYVKLDSLNTTRTIADVVYETNRLMFNLSASFFVLLGIKSSYAWSEQLPTVTILLGFSVAIATLCSWYLRSQVFQADQGVRALDTLMADSVPHSEQYRAALISALEILNKSEKDIIDAQLRQRNLPPINREAVYYNYDTMFPLFPSLEARKKALGITTVAEPTQQSPALG